MAKALEERESSRNQQNQQDHACNGQRLARRRRRQLGRPLDPRVLMPRVLLDRLDLLVALSLRKVMLLSAGLRLLRVRLLKIVLCAHH
jgi:hypothetical protein